MCACIPYYLGLARQDEGLQPFEKRITAEGYITSFLTTGCLAVCYTGYNPHTPELITVSRLAAPGCGVGGGLCI